MSSLNPRHAPSAASTFARGRHQAIETYKDGTPSTAAADSMTTASNVSPPHRSSDEFEWVTCPAVATRSADDPVVTNVQDQSPELRTGVRRCSVCGTFGIEETQILTNGKPIQPWHYAAHKRARVKVGSPNTPAITAEILKSVLEFRATRSVRVQAFGDRYRVQSVAIPRSAQATKLRELIYVERSRQLGSLQRSGWRVYSTEREQEPGGTDAFRITDLLKRDIASANYVGL